jgi:hypothetical protein
MIGLWKGVENLMLEGLDLFNQSGYMILLCEKIIFVIFCNLVDVLLLHRRCVD